MTALYWLRRAWHEQRPALALMIAGYAAIYAVAAILPR